MVTEYEQGGLNLGCDDLVIMPPDNDHHPNHHRPPTATNGSKDLNAVTDDTRISNGPRLQRMEIEEPSGPTSAVSASARESRISDDLGILDGSSNGWRCGGGCCRLIEGRDKGSSRKTPAAAQLARSLSAMRHGNRRVIVVGLVAVSVVMVIVAITIYCCRGRTESEIPITGTNHTVLGSGRVVQDVLQSPNETTTNCDQQTLRTFLIRSLEYELRKLVEKTKFRKQCTGFQVARINLDDGFFEYEVVCTVITTGDHLMRDLRADLVDLLATSQHPVDIGIFVFDLGSLRLQIPERYELIITTESPPSNNYTPVVVPICLSVPYNRTCYPNILHHQSQIEALSAGLASISILEAPCSDHLYLLWCSVFVPDCSNDVPLPPCRSLCKAVLTDCPQLQSGIEELLGGGCSSLPDENGTQCTGIPKTTDMPQKKCDDVVVDVCRHLGFTLTPASGNLLGQSSRASLYWWGQLENIAERTRCSPHLMTFGCSVFYPQCTEAEETIDKPELVGPCESLCLAVKSDCGFFFSLAGIQFLTDYNCSSHLSQSINQHTCAGSAVDFNSTDVECTDDQFECGDSRQCISSRWICDGRTDCKNGYDEKDCAECPTRDESHYRCSNGQCLHLSKRCDGHVDCPEAEDEVDCLRLSTAEDAVKSFVEIYNEETNDRDSVCIPDPFDEDLTDALCNLNRLTVLANNGRIVNDSTILRYLSTRTNCSQHQRSFVHCNYSDCTHGPLLGQVSHLFETLRFRGESLADGDWPWVVSLHGGRRKSFYCGGFLLTDRWVLTAAHCVSSHSQPGDLTVMAGHSRRTAVDPSRQARSVLRAAIHPSFSATLLNDDIALLLVDKPFHLGPRVRSLCLPDPDYQPKNGQTCYVGGWGKTSDTDRDYSEDLRLRQLTVQSVSWCHRDPSAHSLNGAKIICTTANQGSGDIYQGDSGSAVLCESNSDEDGGHPRLVLAGVVSSGFEGGQSNISKALTVQTAIASYTDWIRQKMATSS